MRLVKEAMSRESTLSLNGAVVRVGHRVGVNSDALRGWVRQSQVDAGERPGTTTSDAAKIRDLERQNRELKRANEILVDYYNGRGEVKATVHYRWRRRQEEDMPRPRGRIRILDLTIRDEGGALWDRSPGWLSRGEVVGALERADRVIIHDQASREARPPAAGEVAVLMNRVSDNGNSGPVLASVYRSGAKTLVMLSLADRGGRIERR